MISFLHRVIRLRATIKQNSKVRKIILHYSKKYKDMMEKIPKAIEKLNALNVIGPQGRRMEFFLEKSRLMYCWINYFF